MFTWGSFLSTRQFCYKDIVQVSSGCRRLSLLRKVCSQHWMWKPGSASEWSKSKRRNPKGCHPSITFTPCLDLLPCPCSWPFLPLSHLNSDSLHWGNGPTASWLLDGVWNPNPTAKPRSPSQLSPLFHQTTQQANLRTKPCLKFFIPMPEEGSQAQPLLRSNR